MLKQSACALPPSAVADPLEPTIFHARWWLDIVTDRRWEAVECVRDGAVVARMPFYRRRQLWFSASRMPALTHFLGPALTPGAGSPTTRALREITLTRELIRQLPPMGWFTQKMHKGVAHVLGFQVEGFESSVQFSHEIRPAPPAELWRNLRDKTRNVARKAARTYLVDTDIGAEAFVRLYAENLRARGWRTWPERDIAGQLIAACAARGCGQILAARAQDGTLSAAIFCVWDQAACYYLMSTRRPDSGNGAITLLLWSAIQRATAQGLTFDFDGLGSQGAVLFYGGFGAEVTPRYIVSRCARHLRPLRQGRLLTAPAHPFY